MFTPCFKTEVQLTDFEKGFKLKRKKKRKKIIDLKFTFAPHIEPDFDVTTTILKVFLDHAFLMEEVLEQNDVMSDTLKEHHA